MTWAAPSAYAEPAPLTVQADPTLGLDLPRLEAALRVELVGASPIELRLAPSAFSLSVVEYTLLLGDGRSVTRTLDLADVARADRERVLALVLAEVAGEAPIPSAPVPVAASVAPPPPISRPSLPAPTPKQPTWRPGVSADLALRAFVTGTIGFEPALTGFVRHRSGLRFELGARYLRATRDTALGRTTLDALLGSARIAYEWPLSAALTLRVGPRLDLGAAFGSGTTAGPATELASVTKSFSMLLAEAELRVRISRPVALTLGLDGGGTLTGLELRADDEIGVRARGATLGVHFGMSTN